MLAAQVNGDPDPRRAFANLLQRDALFTDAVEAQAPRNSLTTLAIDGTVSREDTIRTLAQHFRPP